MTEVQQLEEIIQNLSPDDLAKFRDWFLEYDANRWDQQIAGDFKAGRLDRMMADAKADFEAGKAHEL